MYLIAKHPYIKIQREVSSLEQRDIELDRTIYLYSEKVVSEYNEFPVNDVFDMSYRFFGRERGILYIHTGKGVYPYTVKSSPEAFVKAYKQHIKGQ
ncbi:hypothetical protein KFZ56_18650 [Virgibacillus sp. NKC19-3]|uniref:hypothetical protein n=1 Tax=Virgibacillus saliphilus TaxID=2831674 RepID=UPI001C9AD5F5|nr:hypothetical protein [Virgibacillus sp. NKC19-3]MBY7145041.1 hypothetical protein [Virgibacillus sp. NKC19-3]